MAALDAVKSQIDGIPRNIVITLQANGTSGVANQSGHKLAFADGGTVGGSGGPKADSVSAWLSVGEEVTPNPQAGRYRPVLKALAADDVQGARAALGGRSGSSVVNNFTIYEAVNPQQLVQAVALHQNALGAA
jgi:hypothetical protein